MDRRSPGHDVSANLAAQQHHHHGSANEDAKSKPRPNALTPFSSINPRMALTRFVFGSRWYRTKVRPASCLLDRARFWQERRVSHELPNMFASFESSGGRDVIQNLGGRAPFSRKFSSTDSSQKSRCPLPHCQATCPPHTTDFRRRSHVKHKKGWRPEDSGSPP
jgi:hypothetical protein